MHSDARTPDDGGSERSRVVRVFDAGCIPVRAAASLSHASSRGGAHVQDAPAHLRGARGGAGQRAHRASAPRAEARAPARFHAPDADASLRPKALRGPKGPRAPDRATTLSRRPTWDDGSGASRDARASSSRTSAARARARRPARGRPGAVTSRVPPSPKSIRSPWTTPPSAVASRTSTAPAVTPSWSARVGADPSTVSPCGPSDSASTTRDHPRASPTSIPRPGSASARAFRSPSSRAVRRHGSLHVLRRWTVIPPRAPGRARLFYCERWYDDFAALDATMQRAIVDYHVSRKADRSGARLGAPRDRRGSRGW